MLCIRVKCSKQATAYFSYGNVICPMCSDHEQEALNIALRHKRTSDEIIETTRQFKTMPVRRAK